jgi:DNA (cytosine-5)-methyltransferase 1
LLGWRTACAVELDEHCRRVLMQRQCDGMLEPFPIWDDVRTFDGKPWRGIVDVVSGGDPCQGNSNAARHGTPSESLGDEFLRVVGEVVPRCVLRENPFTVRRDAPWPAAKFRDAMERLGYRAIVVKLGACCVGGAHRKMRSYVVGVSESECARLEGDERAVVEGAHGGRQDANIARSDRRHPAPRLCGGADAVAHRMERLKAVGNGQVPPVVSFLWRTLSHLS